MNEGLSVTVSAPNFTELTKRVCTLAESLSSKLAQASALVPVPTTAQPQAPAPPAPAEAAHAQQQAAPTAAPRYTLEQLTHAATPLIDAGKQTELQQLLGQYGVQALTQLPQEQYGAFATALRGLGAKL